MPEARYDGVTLLTWYVVLLFAIPSRLTVGPLGGAGSPAMIVGLACAFFWAFYQVQRDTMPQVGSHPVRRAAIAMGLAYAASYVWAMTQPIDPAETGTADLGMVALASWLGVLLFAHDCIPSLDRLITLTRRLVVGAACVAGVGLVQFATGQELVDKVAVPGLSLNSTFAGLTIREGFNRPMGTALHPIEFGAVLTIVLPIALALAVADMRRGWLSRWLPVGVLVAGVTVSVSRSAILGAAVGVAVLAVALPALVMRRLAVAAFGFTVVVFLTVPGMLGTVLGLFTSAGEDPSVASRTGSYGLAAVFFERSPILGRGFGTFLPAYRIFDNQYLLTLIEVGLLGLVATFALFVAAAVAARRTLRISTEPGVGQLAQGLLASSAVAATGLAIYDGFSFPMGAGTIFLVLGLAGAAYRLQRVEALPVGTAMPAEGRRRARRVAG